METREVVLSAAENKDGQLMANTWVVQFITWGHNKHKTSGWAAHPPGGSSTGAKVGLPCPGGVCMYIVCTRVYMYVHVYVCVCMLVVYSHIVTYMQEVPQQAPQQNLGGWR